MKILHQIYHKGNNPRHKVYQDKDSIKNTGQKVIFLSSINSIPCENQIFIMGVPINTVEISIVSLLNLFKEAKAQISFTVNGEIATHMAQRDVINTLAASWT